MIRGRVMAGGRPVAGARVVVQPLGRSGMGDVAAAGAPTFIEADQEGAFQLVDLAPGIYRFSAHGDGLLPAAQIEVIPAGDFSGSVQLELRAGGVTLRGMVTETGGAAIPRARFTIDVDAPWSVAPEAVASATSLTDAEGRYEMRLPPGHHSLTIQAEGYVTEIDSVELRADAVRNFQLVPASRISGRVVRGGSGEGVDGATVRLEGRLGRAPRETASGLDGAFEFRDLEPGAYHLHATQGALAGRTLSSVAVGLAAAVGELIVVLEPGLELTGRVVDDEGRSVSRAEVTFEADDSGLRPRARAWSGAEGTFRFEGVEPGGAFLAARAVGHTAERRPVLVTPSSRPVEVVLRRTGRLSGTVLAADGRPVADALVTAIVNPGEGWRSVGPVRTTKEGTFEVHDLPPTTVRPMVEHPEHGTLLGDVVTAPPGATRTVALRFGRGHRVSGRVRWLDGSPAPGVTVAGRSGTVSLGATTDAQGGYRLGPLAAGRSWQIAPELPGAAEMKPRAVPVVDHDLGGIDFEVPRPEHHIAGRVTSLQGEALPGAFVWTSPWPPGGRAISDADGRFRIEGLTPGSYTVRAEAPGGPAIEVTGVPAGRSDLHLVLAEGGSLAGVVRRPGGEPAAFVTVAAVPVDAAVERLISEPVSVTDRRGAFEIRGLPAGSYDLQATSPDGLIGWLSDVRSSAGRARDDLLIKLSPGSAIVGQVLAAGSNRPVLAAAMMVEGTRRPVVATVGAGGEFEILGLEPEGRITLSFRANGFEAKSMVVSMDGTQRRDVGVVHLVERTGSKHGRIGVTFDIREDGTVVIGETMPDSPAAQAGLRPGDEMTHVDGREIRGIARPSLGDLLRGAPGSQVTIEVRRGGERHVFTVERG